MVSIAASESQQIECTFTSEPITVTAAPVTVGGRVVDPSGHGVKGVQISMLDPANGSYRYAQTNSFGYYSFDNVTAGKTYVFMASAKKYKFVNGTQTATVNTDISNLNFSTTR
jgi:hypothetical protein